MAAHLIIQARRELTETALIREAANWPQEIRETAKVCSSGRKSVDLTFSHGLHKSCLEDQKEKLLTVTTSLISRVW